MISVCSDIRNCPVTSAYVKLSEKIYGPNIAGVRGKTVQRNEPEYKVDQISISVLSQYRMVTLAEDILYVNTIRFFVSISKHIGFGTIQLIDNGKVETL